ncbi:hypothetical protein BJV74DRAFT_931922 [Russula compacta]|nr:hypothetical protein BJV74DRAFT_931922 [Russula compacta]
MTTLCDSTAAFALRDPRSAVDALESKLAGVDTWRQPLTRSLISCASEVLGWSNDTACIGMKSPSPLPYRGDVANQSDTGGFDISSGRSAKGRRAGESGTGEQPKRSSSSWRSDGVRRMGEGWRKHLASKLSESRGAYAEGSASSTLMGPGSELTIGPDAAIADVPGQRIEGSLDSEGGNEGAASRVKPQASGGRCENIGICAFMNKGHTKLAQCDMLSAVPKGVEVPIPWQRRRCVPGVSSKLFRAGRREGSSAPDLPGRLPSNRRNLYQCETRDRENSVDIIKRESQIPYSIGESEASQPDEGGPSREDDDYGFAICSSVCNNGVIVGVCTLARVQQ